MAIELASSFNRNSGVPLDSREVVASIAARDAIPTLVRYVGMKVTVLDDGAGDQVTYELAGGTGNDKWREYGSGGSGSGILTVADQTERNAIASGDRYEGMIVYVIADQANYQLLGGIGDEKWKMIGVAIVADDTEMESLPAIIGRQVWNEDKKRLKIAVDETPTYLSQVIVSTSSQAPGNNSSIALNAHASKHIIFVEGNSGPAVLANAPFYNTNLSEELEITVVGTSDSAPVTIPSKDDALGVAGYDVTLGKGHSATYGWSQTLYRYYIKSVSN